MSEIGSKEEVSAVQFVLDTFRKLIDSVLSLGPFYNTIVLAYASTLLRNYTYLLIEVISHNGGGRH